MSSISKSFEKLDLVGQVSRKKSRSQGRSAPAVDDQHNHKKQRRRSRPPTDQVGTFCPFIEKIKQILYILIYLDILAETYKSLYKVLKLTLDFIMSYMVVNYKSKFFVLVQFVEFVASYINGY